jgi:hypothetical protein
VLRGNGYLKFSIRVAPAVFHDERSRVCRRQLRHVGRDPPGWGRSSVLTRPQGPCIVADSNSLASARIAFSASALKVSGVQSKGTMSPRRFSGSSSHLRTTIDRFLRRSRFKLSIIRVVITSPFAGHLFLSNSGSFAKFAAIRRASSSAGSAAAPEIEADGIMSKLRPLRRLRSSRSMWGLRLRSLLRSLRNLASGQVASRDDVLQRCRDQRRRKSTN